MPFVKDILAEQKALAEGPTLGNLHPNARAQAIARAGIADAERMRQRLEWLHSPASHRDKDGYEWGIFRVKWESGKAVEVWQTNSDFSDLDAAIGSAATSGVAPSEQPFDAKAVYVLVARMFRQPDKLLRSMMAQDLCRLLQIGTNARTDNERAAHFLAAGAAIEEDRQREESSTATSGVQEVRVPAEATPAMLREIALRFAFDPQKEDIDMAAEAWRAALRAAGVEPSHERQCECMDCALARGVSGLDGKTLCPSPTDAAKED
jgi:hypothetical protein